MALRLNVGLGTFLFKIFVPHIHTVWFPIPNLYRDAYTWSKCGAVGSKNFPDRPDYFVLIH